MIRCFTKQVVLFILFSVVKYSKWCAVGLWDVEYCSLFEEWKICLGQKSVILRVVGLKFQLLTRQNKGKKEFEDLHKEQLQNCVPKQSRNIISKLYKTFFFRPSCLLSFFFILNDVFGLTSPRHLVIIRCFTQKLSTFLVLCGEVFQMISFETPPGTFIFVPLFLGVEIIRRFKKEFIGVARYMYWSSKTSAHLERSFRTAWSCLAIAYRLRETAVTKPTSVCGRSPCLMTVKSN